MKESWEAETSVENRAVMDLIINLEETSEEECNSDERAIALEEVR
jgi:hypothetical protein